MQCIQQTDCPSSYDCVTGQCIKHCSADLDCLGVPGEPRCDLGEHHCVQCLSVSDCSLGNVCDSEKCVPGCSGDRDCPGTVPRCDTAAGNHGQCVQCLANPDCPQGYDCRNDACVKRCTGDPDCANGTHCDVPSGMCVQCTSNTQCGLGNICQDNHTCTPGCSGDRDCPADAPFCDGTVSPHGKCVQCKSSTDCGGAACNSGVCANSVPKLDVLFVIDDSSSMAGKQEAMISALPAFFTELAAGGPLPSLHIGVTTSSLNLLPYSIIGCDSSTANGALQSTAHPPQGGSCTVPSGHWLEDLALPGGTRSQNYSGNPWDVLGCMSRLGSLGCGFEHHFEGMKRALDGSVGANSGFLRPDAYLAVVIVGDEDDCSASNTAVFDPSTAQNTLTSTLGPFASFRCTEFGVTCDGHNISRSAATYGSCAPRGDSYLWDPQHYIDFLKSLKTDPTRITVAIIGATPTPFGVSLNASSLPQLNHSCTSTLGTGDPGVRFKWLVDHAPHGFYGDVCATDYSANMMQIADTMRSAMGLR